MKNVRTELRLPEELHAQIKGMADEEMRSMNAQIVLMLKRDLAAQSKKKARIAEEESGDDGVRVLHPRTRVSINGSSGDH